MPQPEDIDSNPPKNNRPVIEDPNGLFPWTFEPIGVVHSDYKNHFDTPRQPSTGDERDAWIILKSGLQNCLKDLKAQQSEHPYQH